MSPKQQGDNFQLFLNRLRGSKILNSFASLIIRFRLSVIFLSLLSIGYSWYLSQNLKFNNSNEMWFLKDDKTLLDYKKLLEYFGDDEFIVIGIENKDKSPVFKRECVETINILTEFLTELDNITKVQSLSKVEIITGVGDVLTVKNLFNGFDLTPDEYKAKEKIALNDPLIKDFLITENGAFALIYARIQHIEGTITHKVELSRNIQAFLDNFKNKKNYNFYLAGGPILDESFLTTHKKDQKLLVPLVLIILALIFFYSFRSISGVLLPMAVIIGTVILIYGFMALMNHDLNILNSIIPIIILAIGIADAVHILVDYYHEINLGRKSPKAAENCIINLFVPCFFTSLTTSISFLAFTTSRIVPLKELGQQAAFGVFVAFVFSITLLPALLSYMKEKHVKAKKITQENVFYNLFIKIARFTPEQNKKIIIVYGILTLVFIYYTFQVKVDANAMNYFKNSSTVKIDTSYIDSEIRGTLNAEFIIDAGANGGVKEPAFLEKIERFQNFLQSIPEFGRVISILDFLKKMNKVMHEDDETYYRLPETREEAAQYLLLYSLSSPEEDLTDIVDYDYRFTRISVRVPIMDTSKYKALIKKVEDFHQKELPALSVDLTGLVILFNNIDKYILDSQITSFSLAFIMIFFMMILVFGSLRYGIISMVPNILPVLAASGVMGFLGINLEFGTIMVACVVIGIGVDDTIHYVGRYLKKRKQHHPRKESIQMALAESGKPIIFTSIILFFGFLVLLFASLKINIYFGLLVCIAIIVALLADLFFLSAILLSLPGEE